MGIIRGQKGTTMPKLNPNLKFTRADVEAEAKKHGNAAAVHFLCLIPPDKFDGDYQTYYNELIERGKGNAGHEEEIRV